MIADERHCPPSVQSPALIALLASLQLAADQRTYKSMTSLASITSSESAYSRSLNQQSISRLPLRDDHAAAGMDGGAGTSDGWDDVRKEVAAITNVGASMLAMAISVWWVGGGRSIGMVRCSIAPSHTPSPDSCRQNRRFFYVNFESAIVESVTIFL